MAVAIWREWTVGEAFGEPFGRAEAEEFAVSANAVAGDRHTEDDTG